MTARRWTKERPTGQWQMAVVLYADGDFAVRFPHAVEHRPVAAWLVVTPPRSSQCPGCDSEVLAGEACGVCGATPSKGRAR